MGKPARRLVLQDRRRPGLNGHSLAYPRGKVLGGCSHQRHDLHARPGARLRSVAADGNPGWAWDDVLRIFTSKDPWAVEPETSGACTPAAEWRIEHAHPLGDLDAPGMRPRKPAFRGGGLQPRRHEGCGYFHVNQKTGAEHVQGVPSPVRHRRNPD
jgi:choline dehydrogenase